MYISIYTYVRHTSVIIVFGFDCGFNLCLHCSKRVVDLALGCPVAAADNNCTGNRKYLLVDYSKKEVETLKAQPAPMVLCWRHRGGA